MMVFRHLISHSVFSCRYPPPSYRHMPNIDHSQHIYASAVFRWYSYSCLTSTIRRSTTVAVSIPLFHVVGGPGVGRSSPSLVHLCGWRRPSFFCPVRPVRRAVGPDLLHQQLEWSSPALLTLLFTIFSCIIAPLSR